MKNLPTFEEYLNENKSINEKYDKKDPEFVEIADIARKYKVPGSSERQRQDAIDAIVDRDEHDDVKQAISRLKNCVPVGKMEKFLKEITPIAKKIGVEFESNGNIKGYEPK